MLIISCFAPHTLLTAAFDLCAGCYRLLCGIGVIALVCCSFNCVVGNCCLRAYLSLGKLVMPMICR